jgi:dolichyl-phosphate-mannose-protein mannosyltransferase
MAAIASIVSSFSLIFGGCCANVSKTVRLEFNPHNPTGLLFRSHRQVSNDCNCNNTTPIDNRRKEPNSGLLITLFQFVFTCLSTLHYQFDPNGRYFLRSSPVPFHKWCISAALFFTVNMLNNWAFAFNISVPVHIILRSFGSVTTMAAGWMRGKRYTPLQVFSVAVLTLGVMVSAWADAMSKVCHFHLHEVTSSNKLRAKSQTAQK